jgi:hypothetical protein
MADSECSTDIMVNIVEARLRRDFQNEYDRFSRMNDDDKKEYIKTNWKRLAIQVDSDCLEKMNRLLHPLMERTLEDEGASEVSEDFEPLLRGATKNATDYHLLMTDLLLGSPKKSDSARIRLCLHSYLELFEGLFTAHINFIILQIIRNGRRYYRKDGEKRLHKNLSRLEHISKEKLGHKLNFLRTEGFSIVADACDKALRNAIAHGNYQVTDEGILEYQGKGTAIVRLNLRELLETHERLYMMTACIGRSMLVFYCGWLKQVLRELPEPVRVMYEKQLPMDIDDLLSWK